I
ncbi:Cytoplasmic protein, partial [Monkeypox virus]